MSLDVYKYFFLFFYFFVGACEGSPISFGLKTQIWQHMWHNGKDITFLTLEARDKNVSDLERKWKYSEANLNEYKNLGAQWNLVTIEQGVDGPDDFARAERIFSEHANRHIKVGVRLIADPETYGNQVKLESYKQWIKAFTEHFSEKVFFYAIENEIDHAVGINNGAVSKPVNFENYSHLFRVAYDTIRSISPNAIVLDHGVSAFSLGLAVTYDKWREEGSDEAFHFWIQFINGHGEAASSKEKLKKLLFHSDSLNRINIAVETISELERGYFQLHYYFNPDALQELIDWIYNKMENSHSIRPIIATEIGYRLPRKKMFSLKNPLGKTIGDYNKYDQQEHAVFMVKIFVILFSEGVDIVQYWQMRFHHDRSTTARLYRANNNPEYFEANAAALAFRKLTKTLSEMNFLILNEQDGIREFRFTNGHAVIWSMEGCLKIDETWFLSILKVENIYGDSVENFGVGCVAEVGIPLYIYYRQSE